MQLKVLKMKTTNFANDMLRVLRWLKKGVENRDTSKIGGFFNRIWKEMKR